LYYRWSKEFLEAGKQRLDGNTMRQVDSQEVNKMTQEKVQSSQLVRNVLLNQAVP